MRFITVVFLTFMIFLARSVHAEGFSLEQVQLLKNTYTLAEKNNWKTVYQNISLLDDDVVTDFFDWLRFVDSDAPKSFHEMKDFKVRNSHWPRQNIIQKNIEKSIVRSNLTAQEVVDWFDVFPAKTIDGHLYYIRALQMLERNDRVREEVKKSWTKLNFSRKQQDEFYGEFRAYLNQSDHLSRLERLLWENRTAGAKYMYAMLNEKNQKLYNAWNTLIRSPKYFMQKYDKLSSAQQKHLAFQRYFVKKYRRQKKNDKARKILLSLPASVPYPEKWWSEREIQIRRALKEKNYEMAHALASTHKQTSGAKRALAEFLSGWLELRFINKPAIATKRFVKMFGQVTTAVSRARAAYWAGRSYEALKEDSRASYWYKQAGQYTGTFYGQQALLRLGEKQLPYISIQYPMNQTVKRRFESKDLVRVLDILYALESPTLSRSFFVSLFDNTVNYDELKILIDRARMFGNERLMVLARSKAARKGFMLLDDMFPTLNIKLKGDVEPALIHAIIHQESRFKKDAVSKAGARGLMQITPGTAKLIARKKNIRRHSTSRLTRDPKHNIKLGNAYVKDLQERFDGSYVLTLAGYNAGPKNADRWVEEYGLLNHNNPDELIDWMEMISFRETRNYVQRVLEKLTIYRYILGSWEGHSNTRDPKHLVKAWCTFFCH